MARSMCNLINTHTDTAYNRPTRVADNTWYENNNKKTRGKVCKILYSSFLVLFSFLFIVFVLFLF